MSVVGTERAMSSAGLGRTLRTLRDPLLLFAVPVAFAVLFGVIGYGSTWQLGFDFRGTLWEPARALLNGAAIYPEPTRDAISIGNPADYPPLFILASIPLALLPATAASLVWLVVLAAVVVVSMWILEVRDWRCLVLAATSPVVVHGLWFGNLTLFLMLPLALAWRYRDRAGIAGTAVGVAMAGKLFLWPLVVWLLLTRRFKAAAWAVGSGVALLIGAWAAVGFEGFLDYPKLLRAVQDVYAIRSVSLSTVAAALGMPVSGAVAGAAVAGLVCLALAALIVRRDDGDRRAFAVVVVACVLASPIAWQNYAALLFVPLAITWPRLAPAWFFGYAAFLLAAIVPNGIVEDAGAAPPGVSEQAWLASHAEPGLWLAAGSNLIVVCTGLVIAAARRDR